MYDNNIWIGNLLHVWAYASLVAGEGGQNSLDTFKDSPIITVRAVIGESALLPCDLSAPHPADTAILVLFFYQDKGTPIYSVDGRGSSLDSGEHWSDADQLGTRAALRMAQSERQGLLLSRLVVEDGGLYHCRVDFKSSPTRNLRVDLEMIVPPRHLLISSSWERGRFVSGILGPYPEGAEITLTCQVTGGKPRPKVTWYHSDKLLDDISEISSDQVTRNSLHLPPLKRQDLMRSLTCLAFNSNLTEALTTTVTLDIAFAPSSVEIWAQPATSPSRGGISLNSNSATMVSSVHIRDTELLTLRENRAYHVVCESRGSRPAASFLWFKDGKQIDKSEVVNESERDDVTASGQPAKISSSTIKFTPGKSDHNLEVSCSAFSPQLRDQEIRKRMAINVLFKPHVGITWESPIDPYKIMEGDSFTLECHVTANPAATLVTWIRDGHPLYVTPGESLHIADRKLTVLAASRVSAGIYNCRADNTEGSTSSHSINVTVKYTPVCSRSQDRQYGAAKGEVANITCSVNSNPPPISFRWAYNKSSQVTDIAVNTTTKEGLFSNTLQYLLNSDMDFGTLLCWATNNVGEMRRPCVIQVVPAAKPENVSNCEVTINSDWGKKIHQLICVPGWNGGLNQTFILEVLKSKNVYSRPLAHVKQSSSPTFSLETLDPGEEYLLIVTAANTKGASSPFTLSYRAPPLPDHPPTSYSPDAFASKQHLSLPWGVFAGMMLGVFATVLICFITALFMVKRRAAARQNRNVPAAAVSAPIKIRLNHTSTINRSMNRSKRTHETLKITSSPILARKVSSQPIGDENFKTNPPPGGGNGTLLTGIPFKFTDSIPNHLKNGSIVRESKEEEIEEQPIWTPNRSLESTLSRTKPNHVNNINIDVTAV